MEASLDAEAVEGTNFPAIAARAIPVAARVVGAGVPPRNVDRYSACRSAVSRADAQ